MNRRLFATCVSAGVICAVAAPVADAAPMPDADAGHDSSASHGLRAPAPKRVAIVGAVKKPKRLTTKGLNKFKQHRVTVKYTAGGKPERHEFRGPKLVKVMNASKPRFDPDVKNHALAFAVLATATDKYRAVVSWGEIDPEFANKKVLVATRQDGKKLKRPRLVVPGDTAGGRYVSDLLRLRLVDVTKR